MSTSETARVVEGPRNKTIGLELANAGRVMLWRSIDREVMSVGRNPECDLCVPDEEVAPIQMVLRRDDDGLTLVNRHPDGTKVGDETIDDEFKLAEGDEIRLGPITATVRFVAALERGSGGTRSLTRTGVDEALALLVTVPEVWPTKTWAVSGVGVTVGTDPSNDICLADDYASLFHAQITMRDGRCFVRDLGSRNGIFVGERKVGEAEVGAGDQLRIGKSTVVISSAGGEGAASGHVTESVRAPPTLSATLVGGSTAMDRVRQLATRMAQHDAPVLITGETGTGKEIVARMLVELGPRAKQSYITLNCGALGKNLIESELFGHEKGAFTGAHVRREGAFEAADGGTLFLDEIGELPLELQPQLLRVVEYGEVRRVGGNDNFKVNVRLIAATNRNLQNEVESGSFREDLFHRLHVLTIKIPSLRERRDDIPLLIEHFLDSFVPEGAEVRLSTEAVAKLQAHDWPGNVRELRNVLQRATLMRAADRLDTDDLVFSPSTLSTRVQATGAVSGRTLAIIERQAIIAELVRHNGNKKEAAAALGVSRSTIHRKVEEYGIDINALISG